MVHPPPINFFTIFLLPAVFRKGMMKRMSDIFSKFIFWLENIVYILVFLIYEVSLVPFIYVKVSINIIRLATFFNMLFLLSLWILFGILFLIYGVFKDMFFFFKTLCDYKDEDDQYKEKEEEDAK